MCKQWGCPEDYATRVPFLLVRVDQTSKTDAVVVEVVDLV